MRLLRVFCLEKLHIFSLHKKTNRKGLSSFKYEESSEPKKMKGLADLRVANDERAFPPSKH